MVGKAAAAAVGWVEAIAAAAATAAAETVAAMAVPKEVEADGVEDRN